MKLHLPAAALLALIAAGPAVAGGAVTVTPPAPVAAPDLPLAAGLIVIFFALAAIAVGMDHDGGGNDR
ncbi:MAG: hypothetical protein IT545_04190 [Rhodobacteraceae bacterium]|nr:hypothetical protein [Paracoccaceae bacterium]